MTCYSDNTFSTLDATAFDWSLVSDSDSNDENLVDAHDVLK